MTHRNDSRDNNWEKIIGCVVLDVCACGEIAEKHKKWVVEKVSGCQIKSSQTHMYLELSCIMKKKPTFWIECDI